MRRQMKDGVGLLGREYRIQLLPVANVGLGEDQSNPPRWAMLAKLF